MEKMLGKILNYIEINSVKINNAEFVRSKQLSEYILKLYQQHNKSLNSDPQ